MKRQQEKKIQLLILQTKSLPSQEEIKLCSELVLGSSALFGQKQQNMQEEMINKQKSEEDFIGMLKDKKQGGQKLLDLYLYTEKEVYFTELIPDNLNKQLNWLHNKKFTQSLINCLSGKNKNVLVQFANGSDPKLTLSCQYEDSGIRIMFFEVEMVCLHKPPLQHAKNMLKSHNQRTIRLLKDLQSNYNFYTHQIQRCQSLLAQVKDSYITQINHIKTNFLPLVNRIKEKTRVYFKEDGKPQLKHPNNREQEQSTQSRRFQKLKKVPSADQRDSQNFQKLFGK